MYKRNQVEWALWQTLDRGQLTSDEAPPSVRNTLRRLIDVDRKLWVNTRAQETWRHRFAFIEGVPQGRGGENHYRLEEAVMLWLALQYLAIGLPQTETIQFLRALKPKIDLESRRIFTAESQRIAAAVKERGATARALRTRTFLSPENRLYVVTSTVSGQATSSHGAASRFSHICRGEREIAEAIDTYAQSDGRAVLLEIANAIVSIAYFLELSPLMKRGRAPAT